MRTTTALFAALLSATPFALVSCDDGSEGFMVGSSSVEGCTLALDKLEGTTWVMYEPTPDKGDVENPQARARFTTEDGVVKLKYTVKSLADVYDYTCETKGDELACFEKPRLEDWCAALEANEQGSCKKETLIAFGATGFTDEEYDAAIKKAVEVSDKYRGGDEWQMYKLENNNLGNKLQGRFYVKVDERKCRLRVTDMYMTIYNGEVKEDSNPVGTNPFVKVDGDFMWEHCTDGRNILDWDSPEVPTDFSTIPARRIHAVGSEVHYFYLGEAAVKAEEGCTYSMDTYAQWRPLASDVAVPVEDGKVKWSASHTWTDLETLKMVNPMQATGIFEMVRHKQCEGGEKETIDVVCNAAFLE